VAESPTSPDFSLLLRCSSLFFSKKSRKMGGKLQNAKLYAVFYADNPKTTRVAAEQVRGLF